MIIDIFWSVNLLGKTHENKKTLTRTKRLVKFPVNLSIKLLNRR